MADIPAPRLDGRSIHPHVLNTRPWRPSSSWRPWVMTMHPALRVEKRGEGGSWVQLGWRRTIQKMVVAEPLICCVGIVMAMGFPQFFFGSSHPRPPWDHCCMKAGLLREAWKPWPFLVGTCGNINLSHSFRIIQADSLGITTICYNRNHFWRLPFETTVIPMVDVWIWWPTQ